jgi:ribosomal protein S18 acetylase RimI-like enzyme
VAFFRHADAYPPCSRSLRSVDSANDDLGRALAFMARVDEAAATDVREWRLGTALITPELPKVWDASYLRVEDPGADDGERVAAEALNVAREAGLAHAAVVVTGDDVASRLGSGLRAEGFEEARFVLMGLREVPPPPEVAITEVFFEDVAASRRLITLETSPGDEALADQLRELDRRLEATIGGRWFAVLEDGEAVARAWLLSSGGIGQVEDVATLPAHRGRGLARAVVSAAARASHADGNELTFVIADADETTPELYRKAGFEPIGFKRRYVRRLT